MSFREIDCVRHHLSADRTEEILGVEGAHWRSLPTGDSEDVIEGVVSGHGRGPLSVRVEQMANASRYFVAIDVGRCSGETSECSSELADRILTRGDYLILPAGVSVLEVFHGDYGLDGDTDVLVRLSNGAAVLFENEENDTWCHRRTCPPRVPGI